MYTHDLFSTTPGTPCRGARTDNLLSTLRSTILYLINPYSSQSIENNKPTFAVGMLTMLHNVVKTTIEALGTPEDDIEPNTLTTLENSF